MAKKSMVAREVRRKNLSDSYAEKRLELTKVVKSAESTAEEQQQAMFSLQKLPRDSNKIRRRNRCELTGRPRGYFRRFGLGRNKLRETIMRGEAPGVTKSSW